MNERIFLLCLVVLYRSLCFGQTSANVRPVSINQDDNYDGYELIEIDSNQVFVLAEHWHNIKSVPQATLKVLKYLYDKGNVRILAIEQGESAAIMINDYLQSGDTTILRQIARNTMFWGKENWTFFEDLRAFNLSLPEDD